MCNRGLLSAYYDGELEDDDRRAMGEHLQRCARCAGLLLSYRRISAQLRTLPRYHVPSAVEAGVYARLDTLELRRRAQRRAGWLNTLTLVAASAFIVLSLSTLLRGFQDGRIFQADPPSSREEATAVPQVAAVDTVAEEGLSRTPVETTGGLSHLPKASEQTIVDEKARRVSGADGIAAKSSTEARAITGFTLHPATPSPNPAAMPPVMASAGLAGSRESAKAGEKIPPSQAGTQQLAANEGLTPAKPSKPVASRSTSTAVDPIANTATPTTSQDESRFVTPEPNPNAHTTPIPSKDVATSTIITAPITSTIARRSGEVAVALGLPGEQSVVVGTEPPGTACVGQPSYLLSTIDVEGRERLGCAISGRQTITITEQTLDYGYILRGSANSYVLSNRTGKWTSQSDEEPSAADSQPTPSANVVTTTVQTASEWPVPDIWETLGSGVGAERSIAGALGYFQRGTVVFTDRSVYVLFDNGTWRNFPPLKAPIPLP